MLVINEETREIVMTRGDSAIIPITAKNRDGSDYIFKTNEVVRFKVFKNKDCGCVELQKDITVDKETSIVNVPLTKTDTKIGELISKPTIYWYEVELNPDTEPQTIIGYTLEKGAAIFTLLPEGGDKE